MIGVNSVTFPFVQNEILSVGHNALLSSHVSEHEGVRQGLYPAAGFFQDVFSLTYGLRMDLDFVRLRQVEFLRPLFVPEKTNLAVDYQVDQICEDEAGAEYAVALRKNHKDYMRAQAVYAKKKALNELAIDGAGEPIRVVRGRELYGSADYPKLYPSTDLLAVLEVMTVYADATADLRFNSEILKNRSWREYAGLATLPLHLTLALQGAELTELASLQLADETELEGYSVPCRIEDIVYAAGLQPSDLPYLRVFVRKENDGKFSAIIYRPDLGKVVARLSGIEIKPLRLWKDWQPKPTVADFFGQRR